ncbi:hypothetical protein [Persephonella sp.]
MGRGFLERLIYRKEDEKLCGNVQQLVSRMLDGKLSDVKISASLVCLKHKKSPQLYRKVLNTLDRYNRIKYRQPDSTEVSYPYRMKKFSPYLLIPAGIVLSLLPDSSVKTVFHGELLSRPATKDIFDHLSLSPLSIEDSTQMLKNMNFAFFNRKLFLPELSSLNGIRQELNINDVFSVVERFLSPVGSEFMVAGVTSQKEAEFISSMLDGRYRKFAVTVGKEPFPDIVDSTYLYINGKPVVEVDIYRYGRPFSYREFSVGGHVRFIKELLEKKLPEFEHLLFLNGALLLYLKGRVDSIEEGYSLTEELFYKYDFGQILRNFQRYTDYLNYKNIYEL